LDDIVSFNGASYICTRNGDPGRPADGDGGWQPLVLRGEKGERGQRGPRGSRGEKGQTGATIESWAVDKQSYRVWPRMSDGTLGPILDLWLLFRLFAEQSESE
jgi:hypothetical protein